VTSANASSRSPMRLRSCSISSGSMAFPCRVIRGWHQVLRPVPERMFDVGDGSERGVTEQRIPEEPRGRPLLVSADDGQRREP
jgi:hypothetical protein